DRNVSYVYFTARKEQKPVAECEYEVILTGFPAEKKDDLIEALKGIGVSENISQLALNAVLQQDVPFTLKMGVVKEEIEKEKGDLNAQIGIEGVVLGSRLESECRDPKLLIPLFTTSSTAVIGSGLNCLIGAEDDAECDGLRTFTFERYLGVGGGDVASALTGFYDARGIETGLVKGAVVEGATGKPFSKADVFVFTDPDPAKEFGSYEELVQENKKKFKNAGLLSQMTTDAGVDHNPDGSFEGELPEGPYLMMARAGSRPPSPIIRVKVEKGNTTTVHFPLDPPAYVDYMVVDGNGYLTPAKLTFISVDGEGNPLPGDGKRKVALGDSRYEDGIRAIVHSHTGTDEIEMEPGRYRVIVSKGFEYGLDVFENIVLKSGQVKKLYAQVRLEVDTSGWISGDFHLHANPSVDSGLPVEERVVNSVVEGLEFISSSDHDILTDYAPAIKDLMLDDKIASQVGLELTTMEIGHYQGFPMKYDHGDLPTHGAVNWVCKDIPNIFHMLREKGEFGYDETIVQVNHPRDGFNGYFDQIGVNPYSL
ncbi:MAG: hypothetical protein FJ088_11385, partial [Deltaproteobacteria bacterium]|nr:hypothetical protein [Deltaproteobacteria bacterium]